MSHKVFQRRGSGVTASLGGESLHLEPVGTSAIRLRATRNARFDPTLPSGLLDSGNRASDAEVDIGGDCATLHHGRATAEIRQVPRGLAPTLELTFRDRKTGRVLLSEEMPHILYPNTRHYAAREGDLWHVETCFAAHEDERIYGLGQHQHGRFDQKGCVIDLIQMNSEVSIPFLLSSRGYGVIWNQPGIGRVELAANRTRWVMEATPQLDYVVIAGEGPEDILSEYATLTGHPPMLPDWALGFWQCKLKYASQDEVLSVAREYKRRGLPLDCIVIDFFNWTRGGEWRFDPEAFPDPSAMVEELRGMGIHPMVSIWPTVNTNADTFGEMRDAGFLITHRRGVQAGSVFVDANSDGLVPLSFYDATHPDARAYHWDKVMEGYGRFGINAFWLDANEPEVYPAQPDNLRFHAGDGQAVMNAYPFLHQEGYATYMAEAGMDDGLMLSRSAWIGSQRFPVVVWSGDVHSSFADLAKQVRAGLNMALSGIPWWTTDIGGFKGGNIRDPAFHELLTRWFQYGVFCPVFRLHGFRMDSEGDPRLGREFLFGGADNEIWSFGEEVYDRLAALLHLRERLKPYLRRLMAETHETGRPVMRPLLLAFPEDPAAWGIEDQYLFGPDLLIAPILEAGADKRDVYLPKGAAWTDVWEGVRFEGGQVVTVKAPIDRIPVFVRDGAGDDLSGIF